MIRHGQASHNVEEQAAQKQAQQSCLDEGLAADAPQTKQRMEQARQEILENPTFFDAQLSAKGNAEATSASQNLQSICTCLGIDFPTEVMVSPLQRTLQTANLVFPHHANILVREELRERLTGRPADNRASSAELSKTVYIDLQICSTVYSTELREKDIKSSCCAKCSLLTKHEQHSRTMTSSYYNVIFENKNEGWSTS